MKKNEKFSISAPDRPELTLEQLWQELEARTKENILLNEVISTIGSTLKLDEVLSHVVDTITRATSCHAAFIYLYDQEKEQLVLASTSELYSHHIGKISMPLIKEISVAGMAPTEVERTVTEQLSKMFRAPDVTVIVSQSNSQRVFMIGAVKKEGPLHYNYRMTVMQAISEAGGLTDYAKRKRIYVIRDENGRQYQFPFDYDAVMKGMHMETNRLLQPGDTVVVPH